jgi:O-antigen/teichoic acid export membrane protein
VWPVVEQFAAPLAQFVMTPWLLHRMEAREFALWVVAQSLLVGAPTLSLGRSVAILSIVPRYEGIERATRTRVLVGSSLRLIAWLAVALAAVGLVAQALLGSVWPDLAGLGVFILLVAGWLALTECESVFTASLKSYRAFGWTACVETAARAAQVSLVLLLIGEKAPATAVLSIALATTAVKLVTKVLLLRCMTRHAGQQPTNPTPDFSNLSFWSWINVVSGILFYSFDRWAVGVYMGSAALAAYSVCSQLAQLTHSVPAAAAQVLIPWAAARRNSAQPEADAKAMRDVAIVAAFLACIPALVLLALAPQILSLWISPQFADAHTVLLRHLAFVFLLLAICIPFFDILIGLGDTRFAALLSLFAAGLYSLCTLLVAPARTVQMADLKVIYAVVALGFIARLLLYLAKTRLK